MTTLREKLASGRRLFGTHVNLTDHRICEALGRVGFDYLWIDTEHTSTDYKELEIHLIAGQATGTPVIVRIPWNDPVLAKRVLEMGPDGIVFPMVNNASEAKAAMDSCLYPPDGTRGFGPFRAIQYGILDAEEYVRLKSKEMCRFVQIESRQAVENLEHMADVPYLDGFILGPCDLSGSVGSLLSLYNNETDHLIDRAIASAHAKGKPIGLSFGSDSEENLSHWLNKGIDFLSSCTDMGFIIGGAQRMLNTMKRLDANEHMG